MAAPETTSIKSVASTEPKLNTEGVSRQQQQEQSTKDSHPTTTAMTTTDDVEATAAVPAGVPTDNEFPISNLAPWRFWTLSLG